MRTWRDFEMTWLTDEEMKQKDRLLSILESAVAKHKGRWRQVEKQYRRFYSERVNNYVRSSTKR